MEKLPIEKVAILARFGDSDTQALAEEVIEYRTKFPPELLDENKKGELK
jgi:hypothetical protein